MIKEIKGTMQQVSDLEFIAVASDESVDSDGDVILNSAWSDLSRFKNNSVILWGHSQQIPAIARATQIWSDQTTKQLKVQIEFPEPGVSELSDTIRKLVKGGFLNALSVSFLGKQYDPIPGGGKMYKSVELLEISVVNCPANSGALITARSAGLLTAKELKLLGNSDPQQKQIDRIMRKKLIEMGYDPDSDMDLKHWEIDTLKYDIAREIKDNSPIKGKEEIPLFYSPPIGGHVHYDFRGQTMAKIKAAEEKEEKEKYQMARCFR